MAAEDAQEQEAHARALREWAPANSRYLSLIVEAQSIETTAERLRELAAHSSLLVRFAVVDNPGASDDTILAMIGDPRNAGRLSYFAALRGRPALEQTLVGWPDARIRADLAFTYGWAREGKLARATQVLLAQDPAREVRVNLARSATYRDLLDLLIADPEAVVRGASADNPRMDRDQMDRLLADRRSGVRSEAIFRGHRFPDREQLLRAASDKSSNVRWNVIFHVNAPTEALELLADDPDELKRRHVQAMLGGEEWFSAQERSSQAAKSAAAIPGEFDPH